jgi:MFS superfamily sulfate permease-like transporter
LRLSHVVKLISDSILVGFKIGAGLTIALTQLPSLVGIPSGGRDFIGMAAHLAMNLGQAQPIVVAVGLSAIVLLLAGERLLPGRPIALAVVVLSIIGATVLALPELGVPTTGKMVSGPPVLDLSMLQVSEIEAIVPLAGACVLLSYIESISAGRTFAAKHGYSLDTRQELLGLAAANVLTALGHGYPVAGGLSQSAVNDKAGARTPLALVFTSVALAGCLVFFAGALQNLPKAVLAAVVLTAIWGLLDVRALLRTWRVSRIDFYAAVIALGAVLCLGILQGLLFAVVASILLVLIRAARPHVAFLGRIPGTSHYSDIARHPENERLPGVLAFRPEAPIFYVNADAVLEAVLAEVRAARPGDIRSVVCDLSASPDIDLAGACMLHGLHSELAPLGIGLRIVGAHGQVRDVLRAEGIGEQVGELHRLMTLDRLLAQIDAPGNAAMHADDGWSGSGSSHQSGGDRPHDQRGDAECPADSVQAPAVDNRL